MKKFFLLILFILICQLPGIIGSVFTVSAIPGWYAYLQKPAFNPPNWIFGPVWISLYTMMGISLFLIWLKKKEYKLAKPAIILFLFHLILNGAWSILFFGLKNPLLALIDIFFLWLIIIILVWQFWLIRKPAAYLLFPYLAWVSFAMVLNFEIWRLNP